MSHTARMKFAEGLRSGPPQFVPFCHDALSARLLTSLGYAGGYISGAGVGYSHALSEALLCIRDLSDVVAAVRRRSDFPLVVDGGVGFGDAIHTQRAVWELEQAGASAIEIEDQVAPKRVGHHRGIERLVDTEVMVGKVRAAVGARSDNDFMIIARTNALAQSYDVAVARGRAYVDAGADAVMVISDDPLVLSRFATDLNHPVVALALFGDRGVQDWADSGVSMVIDPQSAYAAALDAQVTCYERFLQNKQCVNAATVSRAQRLFDEYCGIDGLYETEMQTVEGVDQSGHASC